MSLCLISQNKDSVFIGADTATSMYIESLGNRFIRSSNDGKKLFEIGKDIVFCSGDMSEVPDIIKNMKTKNGYVDLDHISRYLKGKNFKKCPTLDFPSICVIICRVIDSNSYVYILESENNFEGVAHSGKYGGIQLWVGGIYNERCLKIATEELEKSHRQAIDTYINTYKRMACDEIGGNLNVYYLNSEGYKKIIDNYDLNDGYKPFSLVNGFNHGVIAQALVGNMILGNTLDIGNKTGSVYIDGDGITITNGVIKSHDYNEDEGTGSIIDLRDGTFSFASGGLAYREDENTDNKEKKLSVKGDIEATSIFAHNSYSLFSNGEKNVVLYAGCNPNNGATWNTLLRLNSYTYINMQETNAVIIDDKGYGHRECNIEVKADNIKLQGNAYSQTGQIITSDRNMKNNIQELDKEKSSQFIYSLKPSKFKYNDSASGRFHHGFIAQEVKESLGEEDNAVYVEQKDGTKGLRYEEFIADLVATVQMQNERIRVLEEKLNGLNQ